MRDQLTPTKKARIKKREERRRRERRQREDEHRKRIERLRRQIEAARKHRQRMLLLFLLAVLAMQESIFAAFRRSNVDWPHPIPDRDWTPDPSNDYAPAPGSNDYCDGFSYEQWTRMTAERGILISRKAELREAWHADPDRELFPDRYKDWAYRPFLGEIMNDLSSPRWQGDALKTLMLMSPYEVHKYLGESYASDPRDLLMCRADFSADIIKNFQHAAIRWEIRKAREAEKARQEKELSRKSNNKDGNPEPK